MNREQLAVVDNIKGYRVLETFLFGKFYAWICDAEDTWTLEKIEE